MIICSSSQEGTIAIAGGLQITLSQAEYPASLETGQSLMSCKTYFLPFHLNHAGD